MGRRGGCDEEDRAWLGTTESGVPEGGPSRASGAPRGDWAADAGWGDSVPRAVRSREGQEAVEGRAHHAQMVGAERPWEGNGGGWIEKAGHCKDRPVGQTPWQLAR